jgi:hypothetical protein
VDSTREHLRLSYGDEMELVALIGPPVDKTFPVQLVLPPDAVGGAEKAEAVGRELDFYLLDAGGPTPWQYAIYHCGTAANVYSKVHWGYFPEGAS